jgi:hypothetical protein
LMNIVEDSEWQRFDARWRRVFFGVAAKLAVQAKIGAVRAYKVAGVQGPHTGEALTDGAEVVLHRSRSDRLVAGVSGKGSNSDAMSKDLEDFDLVGEVKEQGVLVDGDAKGGPHDPIFAGGSTAARNDSGGGRFFCKAEIAAELIFGLSGQRTQDSC